MHCPQENIPNCNDYGVTLKLCTYLKHRHAKRAGVIFSIDWVAWAKTGC